MPPKKKGRQSEKTMLSTWARFQRPPSPRLRWRRLNSVNIGMTARKSGREGRAEGRRRFLPNARRRKGWRAPARPPNN